ncbi:MAG TPA: ribosome maturation factor RimM [Ignavibacteriaceae bacterium]|nr:ribosome maturation factor RimM [Ignavibacteriaceae bacterium]
MSEYFLIARIESDYGKEGFVKITSFSDFPERFFNLQKVYVDFFDDKKEFFVEKTKKINDVIFLKFRNFDSQKDIQSLIGKEIFVDEQSLIVLPEGYFFIHDLLGSKVYRNNLEFGILADVLTLPSNDVYVIKHGSEELLIPAAFEFIEKFDPINKILILKPGDSLYDDDED